MRLAPRLVLAFGFLTAISVAALGYFVREDRRERETKRFDDDVQLACTNANDEIRRQAEADRRLVAGACETGEIVGKAFLALVADDLDRQRIALRDRVPEARLAFGLDELALVTNRGEVLGAWPQELLKPSPEVMDSALKGDPAAWSLRTKPQAALVVRCRRQDKEGHHAVALVGARNLAPLLERVGTALRVTVAAGAAPPPARDAAQATCPIADAAGASFPIVVTKPRTDLYKELSRIDETVLYAGLASTGVALIIAVLLARSLGRPIAELAAEARKVASGEAHPLRVRGAGEIGDLVQAFDKMIDDLAVTRRRLAATNRVAAWREVARRVAHEVKNPLAPIRAAVETLRRLRARGDPAFDEYFDEATRTVLEEVHRIANIVTEFTRFARLPPPRPQEHDIMEVARQVIQLQRANAGGAKIDLQVRRVPPLVRADKDQVIQVLTNLVQNALDAVDKKEGGEVLVAIDTDGSHVVLTVSDNGPGIAPEIASRLFEPYATTKAHGTGLGLAIAQRIAIEHNGELSCIASKGGGGGAVFRFVLPVEGPTPMSEVPPSSG